MTNFDDSPEHPLAEGFNHRAQIPFGVRVEHIQSAMLDFTKFLEFIDEQLSARQMLRFEEMLMPANFSSVVGEFMTATMPKILLDRRQECRWRASLFGRSDIPSRRTAGRSQSRE